jgi:hypothetical protein
MARTVTRIHGATTMVAAVDSAIAAMPWLKPSDDGMKALARKYAAEIDSATDDLRAIGYLGQNLAGVLRALGGAPAERKALSGEEASGGSRLTELRRARAGRLRDAQVVDEAAPEADA